MLALVTDENVDSRVLRGLRARTPDLDVLRVQDVGLSATDDRQILAWAAAEGRVLLTHDVSTMTAFAAQRLAAGEPMAGVIIVAQTEAVGVVIDALRELVETHQPADVRNRILYLKP